MEKKGSFVDPGWRGVGNEGCNWRRFVQTQAQRTTAVGSGICLSDKVKGTWWLFSCNKELLIAAAPSFRVNGFFLHMFFLQISRNLLVPACFVSMSQYVAGNSPQPPLPVSRQDEDKRPQCSQTRRCSGVEVLTLPTLKQNTVPFNSPATTTNNRSQT
ncbi:hypothetical protein PAMP_023313 [Pampus punctatissimus]